MELIGEHEIYRLGSKLAGIEETRDMYHFMGANAPKNDAAITTDGLHDVELVLKRERGGGLRLSHRENERLPELGEVKVMTERGGWKEVEAEKPASGEEEAVVRKAKRRCRVGTRLAFCFCSQCQISRYEECHINRTYPALVPALIDGQVRNGHHGHRGIARRRREASADQVQVPSERMQGVESYWDPVGGERSGFCSRILGEP